MQLLTPTEAADLLDRTVSTQTIEQAVASVSSACATVPAMRIYEGIRTDEGCRVTVNGKAVNPRFDLRNHSPDGFNWSYCGSGPAQTSLAILADCLQDDELAQDLYQHFKRKVIALLDGDHWTLTETEIRAKVAELLAGRGEG